MTNINDSSPPTSADAEVEAAVNDAVLPTTAIAGGIIRNAGATTRPDDDAMLPTGEDIDAFHQVRDRSGEATAAISTATATANSTSARGGDCPPQKRTIAAMSDRPTAPALGGGGDAAARRGAATARDEEQSHDTFGLQYDDVAVEGGAGKYSAVTALGTALGTTISTVQSSSGLSSGPSSTGEAHATSTIANTKFLLNSDGGIATSTATTEECTIPSTYEEEHGGLCAEDDNDQRDDLEDLEEQGEEEAGETVDPESHLVDLGLVPGAFRVFPTGRHVSDTAATGRHDGGASEPTGDIDIETELSRLGIPMVEAELVVSLEEGETPTAEARHHSPPASADAAIAGTEGEDGDDDNVYRAERVPTVRLCGKEVTRSGAALSAGIAALLVALAASVPLTLVARSNRNERNNADAVVGGGDAERAAEAARRSRATDAIAAFAKGNVTDAESPHGHALEWMLGPENADLDFSVPGAERDSTTKQRFAMALFYYTAGGDNWLAKEEFLSEEHICDWSTMIVCANETNGREVAELQFGDNNLQGTLPRELLYLETLKTMNLTGNMGLAGSLPSEIGEIASLEILDLRDAKFVGPIPDSFANLRNLRHLDLRNNFLEAGSEYELPGSSVIAGLRELRHLDLSGNLLTHVEINALLRLTRLEYLDISHNTIGNVGNHGYEFGVSAVPSSIGALAHLRVFNVAHNNFGGTIHPNIAKCKRLEELRLNDNGYSGGMPSELGQLKALRVLDLSNNVGLGGSIPSALENLKTLKHLNLKNSGITGSLPKQFGRGMEMETLILDANFLTGSIPRDIFNMRQLRELRLASNYLEGSIPAEVGNATGLLQFTLFENYLEGPLPSEIGNLVNLTSIVFGWNGFNSSLPETLGNLVNLEILILDDNFFTGTLPTTLGNLKNLMEIHVPNNALNGTLPSELGRLTALKDVGLQSNVFTGTIPRELGNLGNIWYLSMGDNSFSGTLPGWIGTSKLAQSLTHFELPRTNLEGTLPAEWGMLSSLQKLKMHGNHLITGTIPIEWANMTKLDGMWIFNTSLTGSVNHLCREEFVDFGSQNCDDCGLEVDLEDVECECCHCCIDNDYVEWEDDLYGAEDGNEEGGLDEDNITIGST